MFSSTTRTTLASLTEAELLARVRQWLGDTCPPAPAGIGDDAAVLPNPNAPYTLLANDAVVLDRHFTIDDDPHAVGRKLVCRNLSDIAAMGGTPAHAIIQLICPANLSIAWLQQFYNGIASTARSYNLQIVGGDCTTAPKKDSFAASLSITGTASRPIPRTGAQPGDHLLVSGELGGSILGHHLQFTPRLNAAAWLAQQPEVVAMIDLTDGIAKDLPALLSTTTTAQLDLAAIPIAAAAHTLAKQSNQSPLHHALCDGEDYELLIAVRTQSITNFTQRWHTNHGFPKLTAIGTILNRTHDNQPEITDMTDSLVITNGGYETFHKKTVE